MQERRKRVMLLILGVSFYLLFITYYLNLSYPLVGHDFSYFLPRSVDTYIHYRENGLSIQWFTSGFLGGMPGYANPQHSQFSIIQLFTVVVNPWLANLASVWVISGIGYFFSYRFGRDIFKLGWRSALLGALFFTTNGFYIEHVVVGHVSFQVFPLSAVVLYLMLNRSISSLSSGLGIGVVVALMIHSGGFISVVIMGVMILITVPVIGVFKLEAIDMRNLVYSVILGGTTGLFLSLGKLYAVGSFLQHFPRLVTDMPYYSSWGSVLLGIVFQFIGVPFFVLPYYLISLNSYGMVQMMRTFIGGGQFGLWEIDTSISPLLVILLILGLHQFVREGIKTMVEKNKCSTLGKGKIIWGSILIFFCWVMIDFISLGGVFYPFLHQLPLIGSLHVNVRYSAAFIFPLSMTGAVVFDRKIGPLQGNKPELLFRLCFIGTLVFLGVYFLIPVNMQARFYDIRPLLALDESLRQGAPFAISALETDDPGAFVNQASALKTFEPIFGYSLEDFDTQLVPGSIYLETDGYYNLTNPRSLVYDSEMLFERFRVDEREMMEQFVHYRQPDWDIPVIQRVLNAISGVTAIGVLAFGLVKMFRWANVRKRWASGPKLEA